MKLTHIAGTFVIQAAGSFLNGAGLGSGEDRNVTIPKSFRDGGAKVPYVSAQAWRRWLRNTLIEETGWPASELVAVGWNPKGNVNKITSEVNPVEYAEDDIFGYMRTEKGVGRSVQNETDETDQDDDEEEGVTQGTRTKAVMRPSAFMSSLLISTRKSGWQGRDEGYVHITKFDETALEKAENTRGSPIEGPCTPLPYTTEFYNTNLQSVFCLDYSRLGVFRNIGDRIELDEALVKPFLNEGTIRMVYDGGKVGKVYEMTNGGEEKKKRATALLNALAVLRGGAKQAAYGTDVSPKVLLVAGLTCGNPIFNNLFRDDGDVELNVAALKEIISDYADRLCTPVLVGMRSGYLKNESEVSTLHQTTVINDGSEVQIEVMTPVEAARKMGQLLP